MLRLKSDQLFANTKSRFFRGNKTSLVNELIAKLASNNHSLVSIAQNFIFGVRIHCDREICRQCPWCCCPDRDADWLISWQTGFRDLVRRKREPRINRGIVAILVFYFSFGQRGLRACAPKNRLFRLINETFVNKYSESAQDFCLIFGIHRQIRMLPIAEDAEPFELLALDIDELSRKRFRSFANLKRRKAARFSHHLVFDRQPMTIPA